MTQGIGRNDVINALQNCLVNGNCGNCPYCGSEDCESLMGEDAISLLQDAEADANMMAVLKLVQKGIVTSYQGQGFRIEAVSDQ